MLRIGSKGLVLPNAGPQKHDAMAVKNQNVVEFRLRGKDAFYINYFKILETQEMSRARQRRCEGNHRH